MLETNSVEPRPRNHEVQFYSDDAVFVEKVADFIAAALIHGNAAITFATQFHRDVVLRALKLQDLDIDAAIERGAYIQLDAAETLSLFMRNGWPDQTRFFEGFGKLVESASKAAQTESPRVAVFGEGVTLLCEDGNVEAAIRLEQLGNRLVHKHNVDILCAYPLSFCGKEHENEVKRICAQHSAVHSR